MDGGGAPARAAAPEGMIGPNALLQLVPVLDRCGGPELRRALLARAGVFELPDGSGMIDEAPVVRVHRVLRRDLPDLAAGVAWAAGRRTGDYILVHRIPRGAHVVLGALPARLGAPLLARAVAKHAWTFAGSGRFRLVSGWPPVFEIADNPVVRGERSDTPLCHWHAAVFERLYARLVDPRFQCRETACCAQGAPACRFELTLQPGAA